MKILQKAIKKIYSNCHCNIIIKFLTTTISSNQPVIQFNFVNQLISPINDFVSSPTQLTATKLQNDVPCMRLEKISNDTKLCTCCEFREKIQFRSHRISDHVFRLLTRREKLNDEKAKVIQNHVSAFFLVEVSQYNRLQRKRPKSRFLIC